MSRQLSSRGAVALAVALVLVAAGSADAHRGGFHGGFHGGHHGGYYGWGYHPYGFYGPYRPYYPYGFGGIGIGIGIGIGGGGYVPYPYYGVGGAPAVVGVPVGVAVPVADGVAPPPGGPGPVPPPGAADPAQPGAPPAAQQSPDNAAHLQLLVPENAEVLFGGARTNRTGRTREFVSQPLTPGKRYLYKIAVRYTDTAGKPVNDVRDIYVRANDWFTIDFTRPAPPEAVPAPPAPRRAGPKDADLPPVP
jgi:uncharacterized protein (TIGR03000 family)